MQDFLHCYFPICMKQIYKKNDIKKLFFYYQV